MKSSIRTVLGICAVLVFMTLGMLFPKALLYREEKMYLSKNWSYKTSGNSPTELPSVPLPTVTEAPTLVPSSDTDQDSVPASVEGISPEPDAVEESNHEPETIEGHALGIEYLWSAQDLLMTEQSLKPREPFSFEMNMEQAYTEALSEIKILSSTANFPSFNRKGLRFTRGELHGDPDDGSFIGDTRFPFGLWTIVFEDLNGNPVELKCDPHNGFIYSFSYKCTSELSEAACYAILIGYAKYFGLPLDDFHLYSSKDGDFRMDINGLMLAFITYDNHGMTSLHIGY